MYYDETEKNCARQRVAINKAVKIEPAFREDVACYWGEDYSH
jgi:hypothetical protein